MNCIAIKNQCQNALGSLYEGNDYNFLHWKTFAIEVCTLIEILWSNLTLKQNSSGI